MTQQDDPHKGPMRPDAEQAAEAAGGSNPPQRDRKAISWPPGGRIAEGYIYIHV